LLLILRKDVGVEGSFALPHPVDGTSEFDGQQRVGACLVVFLFDAFGEDFGLRALAFEQCDGFAEGPFQMRIADLASCGFVAFSGGGIRAFDQSRVRQKIADGRESFDVVNFVQHRRSRSRVSRNSAG